MEVSLFFKDPVEIEFKSHSEALVSFGMGCYHKKAALKKSSETNLL